MDASVRILTSSNRHFSHSLLSKSPPTHFKFSCKRPLFSPPLRRPIHPPKLFLRANNSLPHSSRIHFQYSSSSPHFSSPLFATNPFLHILSGPNQESFNWHFSSRKGNDWGITTADKEGPDVTVVLLGWLGAKPKHLRRYVELYNSKGFHAVTFSASVREVLSFDLGRKLEGRVGALASELASWLSKSENDGRDRFLVFHTFSNTGWLAYGAILDKLHEQQDLLKKIKGCVVDSGGDPNIDPKVWAAGFTAALLKKRSSSANSSCRAGEENNSESGLTTSEMQEKIPTLVECLLLSSFEKFFSLFLNLPDVKQRLMKIISALSMHQPDCQLYLYSTADKVIPHQSIESFIEDQSRMKSKIRSFNFGSSPHVDHYRTFPSVYASQLQRFFQECFLDTEKVSLPSDAS